MEETKKSTKEISVILNDWKEIPSSIEEIEEYNRTVRDSIVPDAWYPVPVNLKTPIDILRDFNAFSLDKIEKHIGMPQGYLSKAIKNKRALPKEWEATLKKYLLNLAKDINEKME